MPGNASANDTSALIFETLKSELLDLTIKPGEEIEESSLCERFSVTRPPVRTALRRLSDIGLVEIKPYYGTHATMLDLDKVCQIMHMRVIVETKIIQDFVSSKPNPFLLEELEHNIRLQKIMLEQKNVDRNSFFELDNDLHRTWFEQEHCLAIWNMIQDQKIEYTRFRMLDYKTNMKYSDIINDHAELVSAIKKGDLKLIPKLVGQHLNNGIKRLGDKFLSDYAEYIVPPKDINYWLEYNNQFYK